MLNEYARQYESLWRGHWWWRSRRRYILDLLGRLATARPADGPRILDVGCGNGLFFDDLLRFGDVRGIESDALLVSDDGPHRARIEVRAFDQTYVPPGGEGSLDLVLMLDVLEHLSDDRAAARHVQRLLKPGGRLVATVPALMMLWSRHDVANQHHRRYDKRAFRAVIEGAGLRIEQVHYFFGWTVVPMLLRRLLSPGETVGSEAGEYRVRIPARPVNAAMYAMSRLEQLTLGRWGLPVGSSLVAVARKED